jgi:hypothetical protein
MKKVASNDSYGKIDNIVLQNEEPYVVIEFGRYSEDWFQKLYQGFRYLQRMYSDNKTNLSSKEIVFAKPLLLAIVTITNTGTVIDRRPSRTPPMHLVDCSKSHFPFSSGEMNRRMTATTTLMSI